MMRRSRPHNSGFTWFEVMVTIIVIGILASILMPAFTRALDRAHQATCMANEMEMSRALTSYTQDYDEHFPPIEAQRETSSWKDSILIYLKGVSTFRCPTNPSRYSTDENGVLPASYGFNSCASTWNPILEKSGKSAHPTGRLTVSIPMLDHPADTIMIGETVYGTVDISPSWAFSSLTCDPQGFYQHVRYPTPIGVSGGKSNFVFFDGHSADKDVVSTLFPIQTNNWQIEPIEPSITEVNDPAAPNCNYSASQQPLCGY
ncbi:MAG TPA: type II secretion system protein [Armatimonadota bacterium]|nr:type II secretion system protein [Armatimonadota bacterium]